MPQSMTMRGEEAGVGWAGKEGQWEGLFGGNIKNRERGLIEDLVEP